MAYNHTVLVCIHLRLQCNWKVRQRKDRTVESGENLGFVVLLSNDVLRDLRLSFHLLSLCMVHLKVIQILKFYSYYFRELCSYMVTFCDGIS